MIQDRSQGDQLGNGQRPRHTLVMAGGSPSEGNAERECREALLASFRAVDAPGHAAPGSVAEGGVRDTSAHAVGSQLLPVVEEGAGCSLGFGLKASVKCPHR